MTRLRALQTRASPGPGACRVRGAERRAGARPGTCTRTGTAARAPRFQDPELVLNGGRRGELRACGASPAPRAAAGSADVPIPADKGLSSRAGSPRPAAGARHRSGRSAHARSFLPSGRPRTALPPVPSRLGAGELGPKAVTRSGGYRGNPQRSWQRHWQVHRPLSAFRNIESRHKDSCSQAARLQEGPIPWAGSAGGAGPGHCGAPSQPRGPQCLRCSLALAGPSHSLNTCACLLCTREATSLTISGEMNTTVQLVIRMKK